MQTQHSTAPVIGSYSKSIEGGISINFGTSGGANCDDGCTHKGSTCYAERLEIRPDRQQLRTKLERHEAMPPALVCGVAILEIQRLVLLGAPPPWIRFSTAGSLPQPDSVRGDSLFASQFRALLQLCEKHSIPVHIPVETYSKARFYRALAGSLVVIRESAQTRERFFTAAGAVSFADPTDKRRTMTERIDHARNLAVERTRRSGRKAIVCPAVTANFRSRLGQRKNPLAKCGNCTACAEGHIDVVYPLH